MSALTSCRRELKLPITNGTLQGATNLDQHPQAADDDGYYRDDERDEGEAATGIQDESQRGGDEGQWSSKEPDTSENTVDGSSSHSRGRRRLGVDEGVADQESSQDERTDFEQTQRDGGEGELSFVPPAFPIVHPRLVNISPHDIAELMAT